MERRCPQCQFALPAGELVCPRCGMAQMSAQLRHPSAVEDGAGFTDERGYDKRVGECIAGKYRVLEVLGHGGSGVVELVEIVTGALREQLALKILSRELSEDPDLREKSLERIRLAKKMVNKYIVQIRDVGTTEDGRIYYTMDYVRGRNLGAILKEEGPLPPRRAMLIACRILRALTTPHAAGVIHADIKPGHIVVEPKGSKDGARVVDFGSAIAAGKKGEVETRTAGSLWYAAPEQLRGEKLDYYSDLYSVGVILYECISGRRPYGGTTARDVYRSMKEKLPSALETFPLNVTDYPELGDIVARALDRDTGKRFSSAGEFYMELKALIRGATSGDIPTVASNVRGRNGVLNRARAGRKASVAERRYAIRNRRKRRKLATELWMLIVLLLLAPVIWIASSDKASTLVNDDEPRGPELGSTLVPVENRAPDPAGDMAYVDEDGSVNIPVLRNDRDVDGDAIFLEDVTKPANGTAVKNLDGTITYTPDPDFNGKDYFEYTANDGRGKAAQANVTVTVNPINDDPVAVDDSATVTDGTSVDICVCANDRDIDGDRLSIFCTTEPANGTAVIDPKGSIVYTPHDTFSGEDMFEYTISDGRGGSATATVTVTVFFVNHSPVAVNDSDTTHVGKATIVVVLDNDYDSDGDKLSITTVTDPANGTAVINPYGSITYCPDDGFQGNDSFEYSITDGNGGSDSATVTVRVMAIPEPAPELSLYDEIERAIDKALESLLLSVRGGAKDQRGRPLDPWEPVHGYPIGAAALVIYALVESGIPHYHPIIIEGLKHIEELLERKPPVKDVAKNYSRSLYIMALDAILRQIDTYHELGIAHCYRDKYVDRMAHLAHRLLRAKSKKGTWAYGDNNPRRTNFDHSNMQFVIFALYLARGRGVLDSGEHDPWVEVLDHFIETQEPWGPEVKLEIELRDDSLFASLLDRSLRRARGWAYRETAGPHKDEATFAMTCAGLSAEFIAFRLQKLDSNGALFRAFDSSMGGGIGKLLEYLKGQKSWKQFGPAHLASSYYCLYSLEKAADLGGIEKFGDVDWYEFGARYLLEKQDTTSHCWYSHFPQKAGEKPGILNVNTALALLFLSRAGDVESRLLGERILKNRRLLMAPWKKASLDVITLPKEKVRLSLYRLLRTLRYLPPKYAERRVLTWTKKAVQSSPEAYVRGLVPTVKRIIEETRSKKIRGVLTELLKEKNCFH